MLAGKLKEIKRMIDICPKDKCVGCEACRNICPRSCISFEQDKEGFFVPVVNQDKCVNCQLCRKVCPAVSIPELHPAQSTVFAAWALDETIRQSSSSGGVYSVFSTHCINLGGVVNGVFFNDENFAVHGIFDNAEAIKPCRGSKYVQSCPGNIYRDVKDALDNGKTVFFTSTPCQVSALYKFLGKDYENLYTCDFICHGVPSPQYLKECLTRITSGAKKISQVTFRKLSGWGGFEINVSADDKCFNEKVISHSYIKSFLAGSNYRYACYSCPFARNERIADITIGDFWGLGKYKPFLHDTRQGVSLLIVNSKKGRKLLSEVENQLFLEQRSFKEAERDNHQLYRNVSKPENREEFYEDVKTLADREILRKYGISMPFGKRLLLFAIRVFRVMLHRVLCYIFLKFTNVLRLKKRNNG